MSTSISQPDDEEILARKRVESKSNGRVTDEELKEILQLMSVSSKTSSDADSHELGTLETNIIEKEHPPSFNEPERLKIENLLHENAKLRQRNKELETALERTLELVDQAKSISNFLKDAVITHYEIGNPVYYVIQVSTIFGDNYEVKRRYNAFHDLYNEIRRLQPNVTKPSGTDQSIPPFPEKLIIGNSGEENLCIRMKLLNDYLRFLLSKKEFHSLQRALVRFLQK